MNSGPMPFLQAIVEDLEREEGFVGHAYQDARGFWTIGYGTLIDARRGGGIDRVEAEYLLRNRVIALLAELSQFFWFNRLQEARQAALANVAFNVGVRGLLGFQKLIGALLADDWTLAADELLDSDSARQNPARYQRLAERLRAG